MIPEQNVMKVVDGCMVFFPRDIEQCAGMKIVHRAVSEHPFAGHGIGMHVVELLKNEAFAFTRFDVR